MYRESEWIERLEFELVDVRGTPPRRWSIGAFVPLTVRDVREARIVHRVGDGIPIADDMDKGCYVALPGGSVVLRAPTAPGGQVLVASSATELRTFEVREPPADEP